MKMDLTYDPGQDRIRLCLRTGDEQVDWWLTRRIALRLLTALLGQLEKVPLPVVDVPWLPKPTSREIAQEHAMSLEFDAVSVDPAAPKARHNGLVVETISLTVTPAETRLDLSAGTSSTRVNLTRMDSHALVEALALMARKGEWLLGVKLPHWVGQTQPRVAGRALPDA